MKTRFWISVGLFFVSWVTLFLVSYSATYSLKYPAIGLVALTSINLFCAGIITCRRQTDASNHRIYVMVPRRVITNPKYYWAVDMEPGRLMAQAAHVVSKMRVKVADYFGGQPITTIVLAVPENDYSLHLIARELYLAGFLTTWFKDTNPDFYGDNNEHVTAICTDPISPQDLSHLPDVVRELPLYK